MRTFRVLIAYYLTRTIFTHKRRWKIHPSSMLCRRTWWTTLLLGQSRSRYRMSSRIFWSSTAKFSIMLFLVKIFKNSYLPLRAHSRISSGTKVDQLEEFYKILWETPMLTHTTLVNAVRVYRVSSDRFFLPKLIFKKFLVTFRLFSCSISAK